MTIHSAALLPSPEVVMIAPYRLPFSTEMTENCAGVRIRTRLAGITCNLALPCLEWTDDDVTVRPPRIRGLTADMISTTERDGWQGWGGVSKYDETRRRVIRWSPEIVVFQFEALPTSAFSYSKNRHRRGQPLGDPITRVYREIDAWAERLSGWLEVLTDQDAGRLGPLSVARVEGQGLAVWTVEGDLESLPTSPNRVTIDFTERAAVDRRTWGRLVRLVEREVAVPDEHQLAADARAWFRRKEYRRAAIDAGTAAELALTRLLE